MKVGAQGTCRELEARLSPKLAWHLAELRKSSRECFVTMASADGTLAQVLVVPKPEAVETTMPEGVEAFGLVQEPTLTMLLEANLPDVRLPPRLEVVR